MYEINCQENQGLCSPAGAETLMDRYVSYSHSGQAEVGLLSVTAKQLSLQRLSQSAQQNISCYQSLASCVLTILFNKAASTPCSTFQLVV